MLRFRFSLTPMDRIRPWGEQDPYLHWFGLTDGSYWIELGERELLRYSPHMLTSRYADRSRQRHPYVDYYVARLWEDVISLMSTVMEVVPGDLHRFMSADLGDWPGLEADDEARSAAIWHGRHSLDLGYLHHAPHLKMWRMGIGNQDAVSVTWRQEYDNGFWDTAGEGGELALPTETVLSAVRKFDEEFIDAMDERVARLKRTGPPGSSRIDMDRLCAEQADRATRLSKRLCSVPETDWSAVRMGARQFLER